MHLSGQVQYSDVLKTGAVAQVTERGFSAKEVAETAGAQHDLALKMDGTVFEGAGVNAPGSEGPPSQEGAGPGWGGA